MRVAAKASDFEIAVPGIERVAQRRRWLRRTLKAEHALVPRLDRRAGRLPCALPSPALPPPGPMRRKWSRVIWCPCERGCAGPRWTGKPLQIAVDGVPGTTEAARILLEAVRFWMMAMRHPRTLERQRCHQRRQSTADSYRLRVLRSPAVRKHYRPPAHFLWPRTPCLQAESPDLACSGEAERLDV